MIALFDRFELDITRRQAESCSHPGPCDDDVAAAVDTPSIRRQLDRIGHDAIRRELAGYGAWDADELADDAANRRRIVWIACGNIVESANA